MVFGYDNQDLYVIGFVFIGIVFAVFVLYVIWESVYMKHWDKFQKRKQEKLKAKKLLHEKIKREEIKANKVVKKIVDDVESPQNYFDITKKGRFDIARYRNKFLKSFRAAKVIMINMELANGMFRSFIVTEKEGGFTYNKQHYILDNESKYYNMDARLWAYDFHERFTLPVKRQLPVKDIKKALIGTEAEEVEYSANPSVLKHFITSKIAEGIMKGQALDTWLKQVRILIFFNLIVAVIHAVLYMQRQGFFRNITGSLGIGG